jgi:predicted NAD/FAD-dependent oxidoreductase
MSTIGKLFHSHKSVENHIQIGDVQYQEGYWQLKSEKNELLKDRFDELVIAIPSPQALQLLKRIDLETLSLPSELEEWIPKISEIKMEPCWTVMMTCTKDFGERWPYDVFQTTESNLNSYPISWVAKNSSKPGRPELANSEDWVIQASPNWSEKYLEEEGTLVSERLIMELEGLLKTNINAFIQKKSAHRWRYARLAESKNPNRFQYSARNHLGLCGDYFSTSRVESAFLSGLELAKNMVSSDIKA